MAKRKKVEPEIKAEATAKAEISAKIIRQRKHSITEVIPPDVTRARASAWLDILSPITEWAGLKGDALRYQRQQLRIQQDEALDRLAEIVRRKMRSRDVSTPLPPKIVVPALEAASLESPSSPLIEWWANLLVSGATGTEIRPYLINLMKAIGPQEVECLNKIWTGLSSKKDYISGDFNLPLRAAFKLKRWLEVELVKIKGRTFTSDDYLTTFLGIFEKLTKRSEKAGVPARMELSQERSTADRGHRLSFSCYSKLMDNAIPIEVCLALKLLEEHEQTFEPDFRANDITIPNEFERTIGLRIIVPSNLGLEFLSVCDPAR
jgi:hypothetical protein